MLLNGAMGFCSLVVVLFCIQDIEAATFSVSGFPFMDVFVSALGSLKAASAMVCIYLAAFPLKFELNLSIRLFL